MNETIPARFARQAARFDQRPLFFVKRQGAYQPITWAEAAEAVQALSVFLLAEQVNAGDRVLILSENRPEWGLADLAILSVGAWSVPIYPSLTAQDLQVIGRDCRPVGAFASTSEQVQKLMEMLRFVPSVRFIVVMEPSQQHQALVKTWTEAIGKGTELSAKLQSFFDHRREALKAEDTATLIYTSGTTGEPKGVMLSHQNLLSNVDAGLQVIPVRENDLHLSFLPLSHVFERMAGWYLMFTAGASVAYAENMDTIPANMLEVRPTVMLGVPRFFEKLYARIQESVRQASPAKRRIASWALRVGREAARRRLTDQRLSLPLSIQRWIADRLMFRKLASRLGGRLRFFVSGSAPLSKEIGEFFYSVGVTILEGYGLTETSPVIAVNQLQAPRFGSVGPPIPGVEVRIVEDGEILTRGPHVMQGYYQRPEETAAAITDGWFHTGDIGQFDDQGHLAITDRKKDLIKTAGGKFVAPQKLENLLATDPYIAQAFVCGDRRPYCVALIVPRLEALTRYAQEQEITGGSIPDLVLDPRIVAFYWNRVQEAQRGFAHFEQVKKIALLPQEFTQAAGELTPTLKAKRSVIVQRYAAVLEQLYQPTAAP